MVAGGNCRPKQFLMWLVRNTPKDYETADMGLWRTISLLKFWFESHEAGRVSEEWLRKRLGYWLASFNDASMLSLEWDASDRLRPKDVEDDKR